MSMMQEFKEFAHEGQRLDMAVGVVIGAAFGKIVSSFVGDVVMPLLGMVDRRRGLLSKMAVTLGTNARRRAGRLKYGAVPAGRVRLRDHRGRDLHGDQGHQPLQDAAACRGAAAAPPRETSCC